jgi:hypothetical protein
MIINKCSVEGCERNENKKGMCGAHYARMWRHGTLELKNRSLQETRRMQKPMITELYGEREYAVIDLTKSYQTLIDIEDYPRISKFNWFANVNPRQVRGARQTNGQMIYIQHEIMNTTPRETAEKGLILDHKDGYTLHNWKDNLQFITQTENMQKSETSINRVGVSYHKPSGLYFTYLSYPNQQKVSLGYYKTRTKAESIEKFARHFQKDYPNPEDFKIAWKEVKNQFKGEEY